MVKRGSVEDQGDDRGRLLTEVEQLISSGDNTMVSFGALCTFFVSFGTGNTKEGIKKKHKKYKPLTYPLATTQQ